MSISPFIMASTGRHYTPSSPIDCPALEVIVRTEIEKDPVMEHSHRKREEKRRDDQEHVK